jgi:8-oxo-dGTP diphosphatase
VAEATGRFDDGVCGVLVRSRTVLLVHRNESRAWAPDCWDVPGGHVESGETDFEALERELREELGIVVAPNGAHVVARLSGSDFDVRVFRVESWSGDPSNRAPEEHDDLEWFRKEQLVDLALADRELLPILVAAVA